LVGFYGPTKKGERNMIRKILLAIENSKILESIENYVFSGKLEAQIKGFGKKGEEKPKIEPENKEKVEEI